MHHLTKQQGGNYGNSITGSIYITDDIRISNDPFAVIRCHGSRKSLIHCKEHEKQEQHDKIFILEKSRDRFFQRDLLAVHIIMYFHTFSDTDKAEKHHNRRTDGIDRSKDDPVFLGRHSAIWHYFQDSGKYQCYQHISDGAHCHSDNVDLCTLILISGHVGHSRCKRKLEHGINYCQHQVVGDKNIDSLGKGSNLRYSHKKDGSYRIGDRHSQHPHTCTAKTGSGPVYNETCHDIRNTVEHL